MLNVGFSFTAKLSVLPLLGTPDRISATTVRLPYESVPGTTVSCFYATAVGQLPGTSLGSNSSGGVSGQFLDTNAINPARFYRLRLEP